MKLAAALLLLASPALAEDWVTVGQSSAGVVISVDRASVQLADGHASFWDRLVYPEPQPIGIYDNTPMKGENAKGATFFVEMRGWQFLDCAKHTLVTSREEFYDASGTAVSKATSVIGPRTVTPDSVGGREAILVCGASTPRP